MEQKIYDQPAALREIHHRIKNNLQIVSSLLDLEVENKSGKTTKEIIKNSQDRIMSMAILHENLYDSSDFRNSDVKNHIEKISRYLIETKTEKNSAKILNTKIESNLFHFDQLIPIGLITNEIINNSLSYGGKNISIVSKKLNTTYEISFEDDGLGYNPNENYSTLGLKLIKGLCRQINARLTFDFTKKTKINIQIPIEN
jgi:two-component sensor histidine kinase